MFSIFESVILGCFVVNSQRNLAYRKARHLKICEVLGKMKNEDSRGLKRRYRGRNFVLKF